MKSLTGAFGRAVLRFVTLIIVFGGTLTANDRLQMIEQDEFALHDTTVWTGPATQMPIRTTPSGMTIVEGITWTAAVDYVRLSRADGLDLLWTENGVDHSSKVETDSNSGLKLSLIRDEVPAGALEGSRLAFSFFTISGDGQSQVSRDFYETSSDLISFDVGMGGTKELLGGRSSSILGFRYLNVADQYDVTPLGYLPKIVEVIETQNHVYLLQGTIGGLWKWRRLLFDASLAGGLGASQTQQQGIWARGPAPRFDESKTNFSSLAELNAAVILEVTERTRVRVGMQGLTVSNVMMSRHAYFKPGEPSSATYLGMTLGLSHLF